MGNVITYALTTAKVQEVSRRVYEVESSWVNTYQTHIYSLQMLIHL